MDTISLITNGTFLARSSSLSDPEWPTSMALKVLKARNFVEAASEAQHNHLRVQHVELQDYKPVSIMVIHNNRKPVWCGSPHNWSKDIREGVLKGDLELAEAEFDFSHKKRIHVRDLSVRTNAPLQKTCVQPAPQPDMESAATDEEVETSPAEVFSNPTIAKQSIESPRHSDAYASFETEDRHYVSDDVVDWLCFGLCESWERSKGGKSKQPSGRNKGAAGVAGEEGLHNDEVVDWLCFGLCESWERSKGGKSKQPSGRNKGAAGSRARKGCSAGNNSLRQLRGSLMMCAVY
eukprot:CAMPEP_0196757532 /NCGR_PEP_ID=MMETSP1091-20130531/103714_1 /TAXON_ID=302021 /ORGANISM="Rhodomonas sp., Strain CCMP768" /LENGTH=291 /DNA_ID=CAMNT_0042106313 /DNA_START=61 /DNA_END=935 /DNA_ORIENTATION=+